MRTLTLAVSIALLAAPAPSAAPSKSGVTAAATKYSNCAALNRAYPHGVGLKGARDKTSGRPVRNYTVNKAVYDANKRLDRDKDRIACEKR